MTFVNNDPADTRIMGIVHTALRRDLARTTAALREQPYPFDAQRIAIAEHLGWMMTFLHRHHESEDAFLYPLMRSRAADAVALLDQMDADHHAILPGIAAVEAAAVAYARSAEARIDVLNAIAELEATLLPHLDREEGEAMPLAQRLVTKAEWQQWDDEYNVKPLPKRELAMTGLWFMDGLSDADRLVVTNLVPPVPRWFITTFMTRVYRAEAFARWRTPEFSPYRASLRGSVAVDVAATPEQVWAVLADVTRVGEWSHECRGASWTDGATGAAVGATFKGHNKVGAMKWSRPCVITLADAPRELVYNTVGADSVEWRFTLERVGGGTRIAQSYRLLAMRKLTDRIYWRTIPAHHDRSAALRTDLERLGSVSLNGRVPTSV